MLNLNSTHSPGAAHQTMAQSHPAIAGILQPRKKKPYKELTLKEKVQLIRLAEENAGLSQAAIAEKYCIAKSNVCRILQRKREYLVAYESAGFAGNRKRKLKPVDEVPIQAEARNSNHGGNETLRTHMYKKHHIARMFMCRCCNFAFPDKTTMHMHIHAKEEGKNVSIPVIGKGLTASERLLDPSAFNIPPPTTTTTVISPQLPTSNILPSTLSLPYFSPPSISSVSQAPTSNMSSFVLPEEFAKLRDRLVMNSLFSQQGLGMAAAWLSNLPKPIPTTQPTSNMLSMMRQDEDEEIINVDERENDNLMEDKLEGEKMPEELKPLSVEGKRLSDSPSSNASLASGDGCSPAHTSSAHSPIVGLFKKDISTPSAFHHLNVDSRPCLEGAGSSPSHVSPSETHSSVSPDGNCYECQVYKTKLVISENKCRYLESRGNTLQSEAVNAQSQASIVESALRTAEIESVGMKQRNELLHRRLIDCQNKCVRFLQETDGISNPQSIMSFVNQIIQTTILQ